MPRINGATDTDLKLIEELMRLDWRRGDTLLDHQLFAELPRPLLERVGVRGGRKGWGGKKEIKGAKNTIYGCTN